MYYKFAISDASSRKINLPTSGKMVVGAGIEIKPFKVDKERRWSGQLNNLVIWNRFFSPLMLQKTSERMICDDVSKAEAWLTFEEIIAGSINHLMYSSFEDAVETCGHQVCVKLFLLKINHFRDNANTNKQKTIFIIKTNPHFKRIIMCFRRRTSLNLKRVSGKKMLLKMTLKTVSE